MPQATLRDTGKEVAIKVRRPNVEPTIVRDLFIFRELAGFFNWYSVSRLGCNAQVCAPPAPAPLVGVSPCIQHNLEIL